MKNLEKRILISRDYDVNERSVTSVVCVRRLLSCYSCLQVNIIKLNETQ
jgi:hypothetical protein